MLEAPLARERSLQSSAIHRGEDVTALYYAGMRIHELEFMQVTPNRSYKKKREGKL